MNEKQVQKAGDNSQQLQASTIIVNNGIEEKRAREIFMEMFDIARKDLTDEAYSIATQRVTEFENELIPKMGKIEGAMNEVTFDAKDCKEICDFLNDWDDE